VLEDVENCWVNTADVSNTLQTAPDAMLDQETGVPGHLIAGEERYLERYPRRKR